MRPLEYIRCRTAGDAIAALADRGPAARLLAGGTDLLLELRSPGGGPPWVVVDIGGIGGLRGIERTAGSVTIGALTTHADLARSADLRAVAPFLAAAAASVGSPQIRNRGTIGGNVMNAAACADTVPPLVALGARATLASARGTRDLPLGELFLKPYATRAEPDELLTMISFALPAPNTRCAFIKLGRRNALAIARLSVAAALTRDGNGTITDARIVPGAAFPTWRRLADAEAVCIGAPGSPAAFAEAGRLAAAAMVEATGRRWSTEYKEPVLAVLVRRALEACR